MKSSILILIFLPFVLFSQIQVVDSFEDGTPGRFNQHTTFSGSTTGILSTIPTVDNTTAIHGTHSLRIVLTDDPGSSNNWAVRFLSGGGAPGNNMPMNTTGWTGYWLKTDRPWLRTAALLDAPGTGEVGDTLNVIGDGQWHLYEWNMADSNQWTGWVTGNGVVNDVPTATYDAIWFFAPDGSEETVVYLDMVCFNADGNVPVELAHFSAVVDGKNVDLRWITATELNNKGFEIQRRTKYSEYETIAFIDGNGTKTGATGYSYSDIVNTTGQYFYRLRQVDFDGTFEFSNEIMVDVTVIPGEFMLAQNFPNPFNPSTEITFSIDKTGFVTLNVYNILGEKVAELVNGIKEAGVYSVNFDAKDLTTGTYIYSLQSENQTISKKMVLIK